MKKILELAKKYESEIIEKQKVFPRKCRMWI